MSPAEPIHLTRHDRLAIAFRIAGTLGGMTVIVATFVTSSWSNGIMIALFCLVTVGGALAYHVLTSLARCPKCRSVTSNFRIGADDEKRKVFTCPHCGTSAYLAEGFYWQCDFSG
jgi:hypothetical protein